MVSEPTATRPGARHTNRTHPIIVRRLQVSRVEDVTPRMRRVILVGEQLDGFDHRGMPMAPFVSTGFDDHVKIVLASDGPVESVLPQQLPHAVEWQPCPRRIIRDYTPRRFDPGAGELALDFVRHGDGPAATWVERVRPGETLHLVGPKSSLVPPSEVDRVVLVGDETALPAIGRYLDERPLPVPVDVVVQIASLDARQELATTAADTVTWLTGGNDHASDGDQLVAAARSVIDRPGTPFVWAGGENQAMLALRRWCTREAGVPRSHVKILGYWTAQPAERSPEAPGVDALLSPVPYLATRAALRTGVLAALVRGPADPAALAAELGLAPEPLTVLVDYLVAIGVATTATGGRIALGPAGEAVLDDDHLRNSLDDTVEAAVVEGLAQLPKLLRGNGIEFNSGIEFNKGGTVGSLLARRPEHYAELIDGADGLSFTGRSVRELPVVRDAGSIILSGPGAPPLAPLLDGLPVVIADDAALLEVTREAAGGIEMREFGTGPSAAVTVLAAALGHRTDDEAVALLTRVPSPDLVVVEEIHPRSPHDDHAAEHALLAAAMRGPRGEADYRRLVERCGWRCTETLVIGWNFTALVFRRAGRST